jgi:protein FAM50
VKFTLKSTLAVVSALSHDLSASSLHHPPVHHMSQQHPEGRREDALAKQRLLAREEFESKKRQLVAETEKARPSTQRFVGQHDSVEDTLKRQTVGLVHLEVFQQRRKELEEARAREAARTDDLK